MAFSVQGKTAIVTGAGSGINLCFANLLLSRGCNVVFADIALRKEAEESVRTHAESRNGLGRAVFQKTDVSEWKELERMFEVAEKEFGGTGVDIVVPGAGIYEPEWSNFWYPPGSNQSKDPADSGRYKLLDINITHPIRATQLAISHFLEKKKPGSIVHISSIAGQLANPVTPLYIASKHAISGFVRSLAPLDHRKFGIRVTAVAPGVIKTPLWTEAPEKLKNVDTALDEWATPEEVALAMLELVEKSECAAGKIAGGTILRSGKTRRDSYKRGWTLALRVLVILFMEISKPQKIY